MGKFTTIDHDIRNKFGLTLNEYAIADSIYFLSRGRSCSASKNYMGEFIGISKQSVHKIIIKLLEKNLIIKTGKNLLETTELWNNEMLSAKMPNSKESLLHGKESLPSEVKKVYHDGKESLPNTNSVTTIISTSNKSTASQLFNQIKDFFSRENANYYHDGKQAKAVKNIEVRFKEWEKVEPLFRRFKYMREHETFWSKVPLTAHDFYTSVDRILSWKEGKIETTGDEAVDWTLARQRERDKAKRDSAVL